MSYIVLPVGHSKLHGTIKEAKQQALELAEDGRVYVVAKVIGTTKSNPIFVKHKDPKPSDINTEIPLSARCAFDDKPAVASKISATGDTIFLCLDCLGGRNNEF